MSEKKFSKQHEWVSIDGEVATIGITKHASENVGGCGICGTTRKRTEHRKRWPSRSS